MVKQLLVIIILNKTVIILILFISSLTSAETGWVKVPHKEKVVHQIEEEDRSIWVVFSKSFGSEQVLLRFPEDPVYRYVDGYFVAEATYLGIGEMSLTVKKKSIGQNKQTTSGEQEVTYRDDDTGRWILEKHIETDQYLYVLRYSHSTPSSTLFRQFVASFEIERSE